MPDIKFEDFGKTISSAAGNVGKKTEAFLDTQKVKAQIYSAQSAIEKSYRDLGELVFKKYTAGETLAGDETEICEDIALYAERITELRSTLASRKGRKICPVCQAEVEQESVYCMKCGSKIGTEDVADTEDEPTEDAADAEYSQVNDEAEVIAQAVQESENEEAAAKKAEAVPESDASETSEES